MVEILSVISHVPAEAEDAGRVSVEWLSGDQQDRIKLQVQMLLSEAEGLVIAGDILAKYDDARIEE